MDEVQSVVVPAIQASAEDRASFLRRVGWWTLGGLTLTSIVALLSAAVIAPAVLQLGTIATLVVVYGSFLLTQTLVRGMVYGQAKVAGFLLASVLQGVALGFLLLITVLLGAPAEGLTLIGYCAVITVATALAMLLFVWDQRREFSLLRGALTLLTIPMLVVMGMQLFLPFDGTLGLVVSGVFLLVAAGGLLYKLNSVVHAFGTDMHVEASYEVTLGIIVLFWNLLSFVNRLRRR